MCTKYNVYHHIQCVPSTMCTMCTTYNVYHIQCVPSRRARTLGTQHNIHIVCIIHIDLPVVHHLVRDPTANGVRRCCLCSKLLMGGSVRVPPSPAPFSRGARRSSSSSQRPSNLYTMMAPSGLPFALVMTTCTVCTCHQARCMCLAHTH
jgi:hypothetical protein